MTNRHATLPVPRHRPPDALAAGILAGLRATPKRIAPKYFYDARGAALFDVITGLEEYYVTRVEQQILVGNRAAICAAVGSGAHVVEPGAGSCGKIGWLMPDLAPTRYTALDISGEHLQASAARLRRAFPGLDVVAKVCDHTLGLRLANDGNAQPDAPLVFFYPGSSIGNFEPDAAVAFMGDMRAAIAAAPQAEGGLLIGVDTRKDAAVLHAAYNDRAGITAQFNLNVLDHLNALLEGNLDPARFAHVAFYDEARGRVEMHLQCRSSHSALVAGEVVTFTAGELVHTENSYKYHPQEFAALAGQAGFQLRHLWQDEQGWFAVMYFSAA